MLELRKYWHPVALAAKVRDKPVPVTVLDENLVLFRHGAGISAFKDLCIHRGAPLSLGWIDGSELVCAYHGWRYDSAGACVRIPSLPEGKAIPRKAATPSYLVEERYGLVWVCLTDEPAAPLPEYAAYGDSSMATILYKEFVWEANAARICENVLDFTHLPWVHDGMLGSRDHSIYPHVQPETYENGLTYALPDERNDSVRHYQVYAPFTVAIDVRPNNPGGHHYHMLFALPARHVAQDRSVVLHLTRLGPPSPRPRVGGVRRHRDGAGPQHRREPEARGAPARPERGASSAGQRRRNPRVPANARLARCLLVPLIEGRIVMGTPEKVSEFLAGSPLPLWIGGEPRAARSGSEVGVVSPSTGLQVATAACAQADDVTDAVAAASAAFDSWSRLPGVERSAYLVRLADLMDEHADVLGALETLDVGKPLRDSIGFDVPFAINSYRYFADAAAHESDRALEIAGLEAARHGIARGVCALIYPWNAPFLLSSWSIAPALAAGNTVVLKPSELTPLTSLYIARLAAQAGLPAGVLNVIRELGPTAGEALVHHRDVAMISFTGSPETGREDRGCGCRELHPDQAGAGRQGRSGRLRRCRRRCDRRGSRRCSHAECRTGLLHGNEWIVHEKVFDHLVDVAADRLQLMTIGPGTTRRARSGPSSPRTHASGSSA